MRRPPLLAYALLGTSRQLKWARGTRLSLGRDGHYRNLEWYTTNAGAVP